MKTAQFFSGREYYVISLEPETLGHVIQYGSDVFGLPHDQWRITGFGKTHTARRTPIAYDVMADEMEDRYVHDFDHGTHRQWGHKAHDVHVIDRALPIRAHQELTCFPR